MTTELRIWLKCIGISSLLLTSGCAGMQERGSKPWMNLPSPWSTVKNSPGRASANDDEQPVAATGQFIGNQTRDQIDRGHGFGLGLTQSGFQHSGDAAEPELS